MSKELQDLFEKLRGLQDKAKNLLTDAKAKPEDLENVTGEIKDVKARIDAQKEIDSAFEDPKSGIQIVNKVEKMDKSGEEFRKLHTKAFLNLIRKKPLTQEMKDALSSQTGADGGYLIPQDINTRINELKRQYKSAKMCCTTVYTTSTKTGSFVYEDLSTLTELVDMTEGGALDQSSAPKFRQVSYSVKDKGALLPIPNTLLQDEDAFLIEYIARWFAKKALRTENKAIFTLLNTGKTPKDLADWKALKRSVNKDLDPIISASSYFCTNQDGYDVLDSALDGVGRPVLQPDPTQPSRMLFLGKIVHVFSNAELASTAGKAPIFYGSMVDGVTFVDRGVYSIDTSTDFLFGSNMTAIRVIERFDVIQTDTDAYQVGSLTIPA